MNKFYALIAGAVIATPALAGEVEGFVETEVWTLHIPGLGYTINPLLVLEAQRPIFLMKPGACLRGPIEIYGPDGSVRFSLGEGVEYPAGCTNSSLEDGK